MNRSRRASFGPRGILALHPEAWGLDFLLFEDSEPAPPFTLEGNAAIIDIGRGGPLVQYRDWCWDSYEAIRERFCAAIDCAEAERIVLRIDSPGGDVAGCFDLAREMRLRAEAAGKALIAYTAGTCCSAAYALASAASTIVASDTSIVGSIGCMGVSVDQTAANGAYGLKVTVFTSGARKVDGNPNVPLDDAAHANLQGRIRALAGVFFELVSSHRGIPVETIDAFEGNVFVGEAALGIGLIDRVGVWQDVINGDSGPETSTMPTKVQASKYDEAIGALKRCAEGDDEGEAKKAKKALKAIEDDDKAEGDEPKDEKKDAKADDEPKDGEKKDDAKKAKADDEKKDGDEKASADVFALTARVHSLESTLAKQEDDKARAELLAKRPDFSAEVRATLESLPLAKVREAVAKWPRVTATPEAAANALTPEVSGAPEPARGYQPKLSAEERRVLDKLDAKPSASTRPTYAGASVQMPVLRSQADAKALADDLEKQLKELT